MDAFLIVLGVLGVVLVVVCVVGLVMTKSANPWKWISIGVAGVSAVLFSILRKNKSEGASGTSVVPDRTGTPTEEEKGEAKAAEGELDGKITTADGEATELDREASDLDEKKKELDDRAGDTDKKLQEANQGGDVGHADGGGRSPDPAVSKWISDS